MTSLRLQLLGPFKAEDATGTEIPALGRRGAALLAYLAMAKRPQAREKLATLLWGDRPDDQARHSLRQTLLAIRRSLKDEAGAIVVAQGDAISLNMSDIDVDVSRFEALARDAVGGSADRALELYRGELLEGFNFHSEEFESWLAAERNRLRDLAIAVLERQVAELSQANDFDRAIVGATRLLALDPMLESTHRELMRLYDRSGQRSLALRQFKICTEMLGRELDAAPEPETLHLFETIRDRSDAVTTDAASTPAATKEEAQSPSPLPPPPSAARVPLRRVLPARWMLGGAFALALIVIVGVIYVSLIENALWPDKDDSDAFLPRPGQPSLAILPFHTLGGDADQEAFAMGVTEGIASALSAVSRIFVVSPGAPTGLKGSTKTGTEIAKSLGVRYLLEGSVQRSADRLRIACHLVDTNSGAYIWGNRYDREIGDIFAVQDDITLEVVTALQVNLGEGDQERISLAHGTRDLEAWTLAGHAFQFLRKLTPGDNARARLLYQQAIARDPQYTGAWDGLAWTHILEVRFGWGDSPAAALAQAEMLAQRALALDSKRARTYALLGAVSLLKGNFQEAVAHGEKAVSLAPTDSESAALLGYTLTYTGDPKRSIVLLGRAMQLSPYYPEWYRWTLGRAYRMAGQPREALAVLSDDSAAETSIMPKIERVLAIHASGRLDEARFEARKIMQAEPRFSIRRWHAAPHYKDSALEEQEAAAMRAVGFPD